MPNIHRIFTLPNRFVTLPAALRQCTWCHRFHVFHHGSYLRYPPHSCEIGSFEKVRILRFFCPHCEHSFSVLPRFFVRRVGAPLPILLFLAQAKSTWESLLDRFSISRNTLWSWKRLGRGLLRIIPEILAEPGMTWDTLSLHLSRWQYPAGLRKHGSTIP